MKTEYNAMEPTEAKIDNAAKADTSLKFETSVTTTDLECSAAAL